MRFGNARAGQIAHHPQMPRVTGIARDGRPVTGDLRHIARRVIAVTQVLFQVNRPGIAGGSNS